VLFAVVDEHVRVAGQAVAKIRTGQNRTPAQVERHPAMTGLEECQQFRGHDAAVEAGLHLPA
jgi:hypothetical protein